MTPSSAEPYIPSEAAIAKSDLPDKVITLERKAAELSGQVAPIVAEILEQHMRAVNSYYSNLIEGNATRPWDIRKAAEGDYSENPTKRDLQLESVAHMYVQANLAAEGFDRATLCDPAFFKRIHKTFYSQLPKHMLTVRGDDGSIDTVVPGEFRQRGVKVGTHIPPSHDLLPSFFARFSQAYGERPLQGTTRIIAIMAAHHRLAWIHPFLDGNGRVARLYTDTLLKSEGVGSCGIWCLSRGLARQSTEYKSALARADFPRQGDRDGRGALSERELVNFCSFMIDTAIDQVEYIHNLLDLRGMRERMRAYLRARNDGRIIGYGKLDPESIMVLEKVFMYGEVERKEIYESSQKPERSLRRVLAQLRNEGLITETSSRSPIRWGIPEHAEPFYFPELVHGQT